MNMENIDANRDRNDSSVEFLYGTRFGKILLEFILAVKVPKLLGAFLRSPLSRFYIKSFIAKNGIDMSDFKDYEEAGFGGTKRFKSFNDFFTRKKEASALKVDFEPDHLVSPCDSFLSVYKITEDAKFHIKGFDYSLEDFFCSERALFKSPELLSQMKAFVGGDCLVFRLCATDYHRFCYFDDGKHSGELGRGPARISGSPCRTEALGRDSTQLISARSRRWRLGRSLWAASSTIFRLAENPISRGGTRRAFSTCTAPQSSCFSRRAE